MERGKRGEEPTAADLERVATAALDRLKAGERDFRALAAKLGRMRCGCDAAFEREMALVYARALERTASEVIETLSPVCHNCDRHVPIGTACCGQCWHARCEDGRCELAIEEPRYVDVEGEGLAAQ